MGECPFSRLRSSAIVMCDQQPIRSVLRDHAAGSKKRNLKRIAFIRICVCRCSFPDKRCILVTVHKSYWHGRLVQFVTGTFQFCVMQVTFLLQTHHSKIGSDDRRRRQC
jgi:hypothetical protein